MSRGRRALSWALAPVAAAAAWAAARGVSLPAGPEGTICLFRRLTEVPCPGCGLTRAFVHLARGEWPAALADHPLAPLVALELAAGWVLWGLALAGRARPRPERWLGPWLLAHAAALLALWLGRLATGTLPW
jgi:hypothetical protein